MPPGPVSGDNGDMVSSRSSRRRSAPPSAGDTPSTRTAARTSRRSSDERARLETQTSSGAEGDESGNEATGPVARTGARMTRRLAAVLAIVAVLIISLITSLRVYVDQRQQISQARAAIASSQEHISQLDNEQQRWNDPDYVRAQARSRLGWVMPGETGYQVVDANGDPYGGGAKIDRTGVGAQQAEAWWQRAWDSNKSADKPTETPTPSRIERVVGPSAAPTSGG